MALLSPANPRYVITPVDDGNYKALGNASGSRPGAWSVEFAPDEFWDGELTIVGRHVLKAAADDAAGFGTLAYLRVQVNNAAADYSLVDDVIQGDATLLIPASGLTVAVAVICRRGSCTMYSTPLEGSVAPFFLGAP